MTSYGVDASSHQPQPNWQAIAQQCVFALIKLCGGRGLAGEYINEYCPGQVAGAKAAGLATGFYHFLFEEGCEGTGLQEANWFLHNLPALQPGDTLWLDVEREYTPADGRDYADHVYEWLIRVEQATGVTPGLYTGNYFIQEHPGLKDPKFARFPLWLASWQDSRPPTPAPWSYITVWQYSDAVAYGGVNYDGNRFEGTKEQFMQLGKVVVKVDRGFPGVVQDNRTLLVNSQVVPGGIADVAEKLELTVYNALEGRHYAIAWDSGKWGNWRLV